MRISIIIPLLIVSVLAGCKSSPSQSPVIRYDTLPPGQDDGNLIAARQNHERGLKLYKEGKLDEAIEALKEALTADVTYGPAHNSLGTVYFDQNRYYLAAWEFQYAAKLMPRTPEPKNNLGLVFETVGDLGQANEHYAEAHDMAPDDVEIMGNYLRSQVRLGSRDAETRELLQDFLLRETRPEWLAWANRAIAETKWE